MTENVTLNRIINIVSESQLELSKVYSEPADGMTLAQAFYIVKETQAIGRRMGVLTDRLYRQAYPEQTVATAIADYLKS
jgi:hypothetical protein